MEQIGAFAHGKVKDGPEAFVHGRVKGGPEAFVHGKVKDGPEADEAYEIDMKGNVLIKSIMVEVGSITSR